jgi:Prokaryotic RING finger family 2
MIGSCKACKDLSEFDYCPLCGEWFCSSCWGECDDKACEGCITITSAHMR